MLGDEVSQRALEVVRTVVQRRPPERHLLNEKDQDLVIEELGLAAHGFRVRNPSRWKHRMLSDRQAAVSKALEQFFEIAIEEAWRRHDQTESRDERLFWKMVVVQFEGGRCNLV